MRLFDFKCTTAYVFLSFCFSRLSAISLVRRGRKKEVSLVRISASPAVAFVVRALENYNLFIYFFFSFEFNYLFGYEFQSNQMRSMGASVLGECVRRATKSESHRLASSAHLVRQMQIGGCMQRISAGARDARGSVDVLWRMFSHSCHMTEIAKLFSAKSSQNIVRTAQSQQSRTRNARTTRTHHDQRQRQTCVNCVNVKIDKSDVTLWCLIMSLPLLLLMACVRERASVQCAMLLCALPLTILYLASFGVLQCFSVGSKRFALVILPLLLLASASPISNI